jgi:hypothetical protein
MIRILGYQKDEWMPKLKIWNIISTSFKRSVHYIFSDNDSSGKELHYRTQFFLDAPFVYNYISCSTETLTF